MHFEVCFWLAGFLFALGLAWEPKMASGKADGKRWKKKTKMLGRLLPFPATCSSAAIPNFFFPRWCLWTSGFKNSRLAPLLNWYEYYDIKIIWHTTLWHCELSVSTHGFSHSTHRNEIDGLQGRNFSPRNSVFDVFFPIGNWVKRIILCCGNVSTWKVWSFSWRNGSFRETREAGCWTQQCDVTCVNVFEPCFLDFSY